MRGIWAPVIALAGTTAATTASPDPALRNVTGLDPSLLAAKTCQGVFNSGRRHEGSQGALQLRFAVQGDVLTAHFWRRLGKSAYDRAAYAITLPGQSGDAAGLGIDYLGEVSGLTVSGSTVRFVDPTGGRVQLTYDSGRLLGRSDPRGGTEWRMTRVSNVNMLCR
jgi:YD repeat-containing protein